MIPIRAPHVVGLARRSPSALSHPVKRFYSALDGAPAYTDRETRSAVHRSSFPPENSLQRLNAKPVPDAPAWLASSPDKFLEYLRSDKASPVIIRAHRKDQSKDELRRAATLLQTLRAAPSEQLVEVEVSRWDQGDGLDNRMSVQLGVYLDWLTDYRKLSGSPDQRMLYLAQWRAHEEVPELHDVVKPPTLLAPLLEKGVVDLHQSAFYIGPVGVISPLHADPHYNLYNLFASSEPSLFCKHILLLPPSMSDHLARKDDEVLRNTSQVDFFLKAASPEKFDVTLDTRSVPPEAARALLNTENALSCVLQEGDTILVPRRWWHRAENVVAPSAAANGKKRGWTAGVGWWFLPRSS